MKYIRFVGGGSVTARLSYMHEYVRLEKAPFDLILIFRYPCPLLAGFWSIYYLQIDYPSPFFYLDRKSVLASF